MPSSPSHPGPREGEAVSSFALGVTSSLAASALIILAASLWSGRTRTLLASLASKFLGGNYAAQWPDRHSSERTFQKEIHRAKWLIYCGSRGNEFQRDAFRELLADRPRSSSVGVKILLPDTADPRGRSWCALREKELAFDPSFRGATLATQIATTLKVLEGYAEQGLVEVRTHAEPHFARIVLTDKALFLSAYSDGRHGRDDAVAMFTCESVAYAAMKRYCDQIWSESRPLEPSTIEGGASDEPSSAPP